MSGTDTTSADLRAPPILTVRKSAGSSVPSLLPKFVSEGAAGVRDLRKRAHWRRTLSGTKSILDDRRGTRCSSTPSDARRWLQILAPYRQPSHGRSLLEIAVARLDRSRRCGRSPGERIIAVFGGSCYLLCNGRRISGALVHDPARLRPWVVLSPSVGERPGRPRDRRVHADAL